MQLDVLSVSTTLTLAFLAAILLLTFWIKANGKTATTARALMQEAEGTITFLFEDDKLLDATPRARELLTSNENEQSSDWENFLILLSGRFPHLRSQLSDLAVIGTKSISPEDGQSGWMQAEYWSGLSRLTLIQDRVDPAETLDPLTAAAMEHELQTLRSIGEDSPQLIWKRDAEGVLTWANRAYIELSEQMFPIKEGGIRPWPPNDIFMDVESPAGVAPIIDMHRIDLEFQADPIWYEVTSLKRGHNTIHFAIDASAVVTAQDAQRNFVQTLTKTFAQLSVGLAIFDADRRLVMFNPAIVDLTTLPPEFLIGRPTLFSFLDRLRDAQMIPEPKNYNNWRESMTELEAAAEEGNYHQAWLLPNGQTFRVTGKPHPDGAIAFLFEDISDEISLSRKFRSQIDTSAAALDNLFDAIAVFSSDGSLILANSAYRSLWGGYCEESLVSPDLADEIQRWQKLSSSGSEWETLEKMVAQGELNQSWQGVIWPEDNNKVTCRYVPLRDGNHQFIFTANNPVLNTQAQAQNLDEPKTLSATA
ncbi:PAS-domain containing protein [Octadecabacter sp.]|nr:PAS-domain containing protein [Octadecabacter sp.]